MQLISLPLASVPAEEYQLIVKPHDAAAPCLLGHKGGAGRLYLLAEVLGGGDLEHCIIVGIVGMGTSLAAAAVGRLPVTRDGHAPQTVGHVRAIQGFLLFPLHRGYVENLYCCTLKLTRVTTASPHVKLTTNTNCSMPSPGERLSSRHY